MKKIEDWLKLLDLTKKTQYFSFDAKPNSEVDKALSEYNSTYGEPFNLASYDLGSVGGIESVQCYEF